jgi:hypothetical protein
MDVVGHKDKMFINKMFVNSSKLQHNKAYFPLLSTRRNGKEHLFEHVDALLVSGFGWDSIYVCVEIIFI